MRANAGLVLAGERCALVPYTREHVPRYHAWMADPALLEATASEPLTLEEEYSMQESWAEDPKKLTFIVLQRGGGNGSRGEASEEPGEPAGTEEPRPSSPRLPPAPALDSRWGEMVGDVNLFYNDLDDDKAAEIEVMVAEREARRRGVALEALRTLMRYAVADLGTSRFRAKIGLDNEPSLRLFRSLGFRHVSVSDWFREETLELEADEVRKAPWFGDGVRRESYSEEGVGGP